MDRFSSPGLQLVFIGVGHELVVLGMGGAQLAEMLAEGYVATTGASALRDMVFWSLQFGWVVILLGLAVRALEGRGPVPLSLVLGTFALALGGGLAMPASGFWLALIPASVMLAGYLRARGQVVPA